MTTLTLNKCQTLDNFTHFLDQLNPTIGKLGRHHFVSVDKKQSYSMNQIVYRFKRIVETNCPERSVIIKACESIKKLEEAELFKALANHDNKIISKVQENIIKICRSLGDFIFSKTHNNFDRKAVVKSLTLENPQVKDKVIKNGKFYVDKYRLLRGKKSIEASHFSWLLNLGLLRIAEESTTNEYQKKQIRFLAANFLNKAAPIRLKTWKPLFKMIDPKFGKMFETMFQVGPFDEYSYHRESVEKARDVGKEFNKNLAFGTKSPFILIDSIECSHLFPLKFTPLNENPSSSESLLIMNEVLKTHFSKNAEKALDTKLSLPFLFDLTNSLGEKIKTDKNRDKENEFNKEFIAFKIDLNQAIKLTTNQLIKENPSLAKHKKKLQEFINKNVICLSRIHEGETKGIKILSTTSTKNRMSKYFIDFIVASGMYLGAISLRREVLEAHHKKEYRVLCKL